LFSNELRTIVEIAFGLKMNSARPRVIAEMRKIIRIIICDLAMITILLFSSKNTAVSSGFNWLNNIPIKKNNSWELMSSL